MTLKTIPKKDFIFESRIWRKKINHRLHLSRQIILIRICRQFRIQPTPSISKNSLRLFIIPNFHLPINPVGRKKSSIDGSIKDKVVVV